MHSEVDKIIRFLNCFLTPSCGEGSEKHPKFAQNFKGWLSFDYHLKTVFWISTISELFMFSKPRNPLLTFLLSYQVWVISKIQVNFRFERYWWFCLIFFWNFHTNHAFEVRESIACWYSYRATIFDLENPGRLPVQHVLGGTDECVSWIVEISWLFMFLGSMNPLQIFLYSYHTWVTSKIQTDFRFNRYSEVLAFCRFSKLLHYLGFWSQEILCWHSYWATMFMGPQKFRSPSGSLGFRGYPNILSLTEMLFKFISSSTKNASCHVVSRPVTSLTSCHVMSRHVMPLHATSCHVMSRHVTSCHAMSRHVTSCHVMSIMPRLVTSCHIMSRHVTLSCHAENRGTVTRPTLYSQLTFSTRN